jgi:hypothetical protein
MSDNTNQTEEVQSQEVTGRSVFVVNNNALGIQVSPALLVNGKEVLPTKTVIFPNLEYALIQIDELRRLVVRQFEMAAQVGNQVLANQIQTKVEQPAVVAEPSKAD